MRHHLLVCLVTNIAILWPSLLSAIPDAKALPLPADRPKITWTEEEWAQYFNREDEKSWEPECNWPDYDPDLYSGRPFPSNPSTHPSFPSRQPPAGLNYQPIESEFDATRPSYVPTLLGGSASPSSPNIHSVPRRGPLPVPNCQPDKIISSFAGPSCFLDPDLKFLRGEYKEVGPSPAVEGAGVLSLCFDDGNLPIPSQGPCSRGPAAVQHNHFPPHDGAFKHDGSPLQGSAFPGHSSHPQPISRASQRLREQKADWNRLKPNPKSVLACGLSDDIFSEDPETDKRRDEWIQKWSSRCFKSRRTQAAIVDSWLESIVRRRRTLLQRMKRMMGEKLYSKEEVAKLEEWEKETGDDKPDSTLQICLNNSRRGYNAEIHNPQYIEHLLMDDRMVRMRRHKILLRRAARNGANPDTSPRPTSPPTKERTAESLPAGPEGTNNTDRNSHSNHPPVKRQRRKVTSEVSSSEMH